MTRINTPQAREEVPATVRKRLTFKQRAEIILRQQGRCGCGCGATLVSSATRNFHPLVDEHILPLELSGSNDLSNRALYLVDCARLKTKDDNRRIAKARRLRRASDPQTRKAKRPIGGRGLWDAKLKRGFDGVVRPR